VAKLCIASVADQQGVEVEHIVQDPCSDDGTRDWLPQDKRVHAFIGVHPWLKFFAGIVPRPPAA
jgi:hypothetical protein